MSAIVRSFARFITVLAIVVLIPTSSGQLTADFYDKACPKALPTIRGVVERAIKNEARMGASLLRLHFHDCFVNGCDGSVLLDDTANFTGEKTAAPNLNSLRGFNVVDEIKSAVNSACNNDTLVSCADILAVAARDSVNILGGQLYDVLLGRKDSLTASLAAANADIPSPFSNFSALLSNFQSHTLALQDLVILSGAHTIGLARCTIFRSRIYNDTDINQSFATSLKNDVCPLTGGGNNTAPLDATTTMFDTVYYQGLTKQKGLLHSDQELFNGGNSQSAGLVRYYGNNRAAFWKDFGVSMIKMGNLPPASSNGQVRLNCRKVD
ncbi:hypothetical protein RHMOL_Rhmol13G0076800 [Rhododendron molle]|uniref:Uncharacterized protein n=1 Tax=Rhododendron molle TaxID=49168 RepID=A0ACC0L5L4_RHOML|nr:hypothetical protein RHMOL_Rhmol13G0076800 [Rhododendron molle]